MVNTILKFIEYKNQTAIILILTAFTVNRYISVEINHVRSEAFYGLNFEMAAHDENTKYCVKSFSSKNFALFKRHVEVVFAEKL